MRLFVPYYRSLYTTHDTLDNMGSDARKADVVLEKTASLASDDNIVGQDFTVANDALPAGYFCSSHFLGSMLGIGLSFCCGVGGFSLIAPVLGIVNADIGPDANFTWVGPAVIHM